MINTNSNSREPMEREPLQTKCDSTGHAGEAECRRIVFINSTDLVEQEPMETS